MSKKVLLCILDGFGTCEAGAYNAISSSNHPFIQKLLTELPNSLLKASEEAVGLPKGQVGNSEVGHLTIGAGRVLMQDLPRISNAISTEEIWNNPYVRSLIRSHQHKKSAVHLICLISDGGVHAHIQHVLAIAKHMQSVGVRVIIHAITDGRDVAPISAKAFLQSLISDNLYIATISGRFYAMDRDERWDRCQKSYEAIINGSGEKFDLWSEYIDHEYENNRNDEFIMPAAHENYDGVEDGDSVFILNFRSDRVRQIAAAIGDKNFKEFKTRKLKLTNLVMMTPYSKELEDFYQVVFQHQHPKNTLGEWLSHNKLKQLRLAETEKYAHVTYFFNGGVEKEFDYEKRILIASPKVTTYDLAPEMSADILTSRLIAEIQNQQYEFICINYANVDMVGHTGDLNATIKAVETVDNCLQNVVPEALKNGYEVLITSDHGNAEEMMNSNSQQPLTAHTLNPVPIIYIGTQKIKLRNGSLQDVAPTVLKLLEIDKPSEMTGDALF